MVTHVFSTAVKQYITYNIIKCLTSCTKYYTVKGKLNMVKRKGRCSRKNRATKDAPEPESLTKAPHSFVIHRGLASKHTSELTRDFRTLMEPYTASQLKERKNNSIKDFVSVAGYLHVSHLCIFSTTKLGLYLKIARLPRGPTLTFKVNDYCFARDVISSLKKQYFLKKAFECSPLIVMNSFSGEGMHLKLMANMFQNMFPTINISNVQLKTIRRCVLLNYNPDTKQIDFRHYYIKMAPVGLTKGTKKIVQGKIPNLSRCADMAEFFEKAGMLSESEQEDDPNAHITLPQNLSSRGAKKEGQSAVRLSELGPRLTLQLMKVEDGLMDGEVLFHEFVHKTDEEKEEIRKMREAKRKLKEKRRKVQDDNVKQKVAKREEHKQKSMDGIKKKKEKTETERLMDIANAESQRVTAGVDDDDAEYYRQAVGEEPEHDLFDSNLPNNRKRSASDHVDSNAKKMRFNKSPREEKSNDSSNNYRNKGGKDFKQNKFGKGNKFNRKGNDKFGDSNKKVTSGRGGNPKYGWKAQNEGGDDTNNSRGGFKKGDRKQNAPFKKGGDKRQSGPFKKGGNFAGKGKKVLGSKLNKPGKGFKTKR